MFSDRTNWKLAPNLLTQALEEARARGAKILDLTVSNPTRVGLQYDSQAVLSALGMETATSRANDAREMRHPTATMGHPVLDYDPQAKGLVSAREAVAEYYRLDHEVDVDPERIVLTTSTSEGYSFVFRLLCNAGDELLVPKPSYPLFEFLADLQDVKLVPYPLIYDHGWQMDFPSMERAVTPRTRGVVVVHPNNPTGSYVSAAETEQLNAFCQAHGLALIVDEVFLDYEFDPEVGSGNGHVGTAAPGCPVEQSSTASGLEVRPELDAQSGVRGGNAAGDIDERRSARSRIAAVELRSTGQPGAAVPTSGVGHASFAGNAGVLTFTLSGLSKISALPQMKVAWIVTSGPESEVAGAMERLEVIADTYLSMNAPVQWAVPVLLDQRRTIQMQLLERVQKNLAELDRQLAAQKACQRLEVQGGWYAVLRVPVTQSDEELAIALIQERSVVVHPGHFYDFPSDGYLVVSLITKEDEFREGITRTLSHLKQPSR
jgi:aspartate/methionine/tyrosine aminotransferase